MKGGCRMPVKAVVFDMDGTILHTLPDLVAAANETFARLGYPARTEAEALACMGSGGRHLVQKLMPAGCTRAEYHKQVAHLLDERIVANYRLYPNNYIAHDIRFGQTKYASQYTPAQRDAFKERLALLSKFDTCDIDTLKDLMLSIYATPVDRVCGIVKK